MDPITHSLTGACLSRAGLNRKAAYATLTMVVAAEFPDIDTLWAWTGPVNGFQHHRGITHTFVGLPFEAGLIVGAVWLLHRWRVSRARGDAAVTQAPVRWGWLYGFAMVALLSHLLLDYTNNYGIRPFFPFSGRWYAGSFVFIVDPVMILLLVGGLVMPVLFGLVGSEVGVRREVFRGRGWAVAALLGVVSWWGLRGVSHARAAEIARSQSMAVVTGDAAPQYAQPLAVEANPDPLNPFAWHTVSDFGGFYQMADGNVLTGVLTPEQDIHLKPVRTPAVLAAMESQVGRAYMGWSPMPFVTESAANDPARGLGVAKAEDAVVTFRDPRFMLDIPFWRSRPAPPLTATAEVDAQGRVVRQTMDGAAQR